MLSLAELVTKFKIRLRCRTCGQPAPDVQSLVYCRGCRNCFHSDCWAEYDDHNPKFKDEPCTGKSHLALHLWVAHLHNSRVSKEDVLKSIAGDRCHRWIGIAHSDDTSRDKSPKPELCLYPTFTKLFTDCGNIVAPQRPRKQYPRLVSFFGDTGAGKSTVIKNLIRLLHVSFDEVADVPVTSPSDQVESSTSGGIHVYADPKSFASSAPVVYAGIHAQLQELIWGYLTNRQVDCEGLRGAEPLANTIWRQIKDTERQGHGHRRLLPQTRFSHNGAGEQSAACISRGKHVEWLSADTRTTANLHPELPPVATLPLPWVDQDKAEPWQSSVVKQIYPRFLYIFSDIVCYVSRNTKYYASSSASSLKPCSNDVVRGAEEDMAQLIDWARNGHDLTTNQGMKPGLIYIINQDNQAEFSQWKDPDFATARILEKLQASRRFAQEQESWSRRGSQISSVHQLLRKYYESVRVVFLPEFLPHRPLCEAHEVEAQYQLLYGEIDRRSKAAADRRKDAGLLMDLERISRHSIGVLTKLADNFHSPVDLYDMLETSQPYPSNFKSHVLNFLTWFTNEERAGPRTLSLDPGSESSVIERVTPFVATCVAGEIARTRQGQHNHPS